MSLQSAPSPPTRVILAFDLDNFYVACERQLNPSLVGLPVGIQQKNILATCSYEARANGVTKLCRVSDAKKACPELVIVNGESLTEYRRFSRKIWKLVKSIVWGPVEKLGMDELFCDVTGMVDAHIQDLARTNQGSSSGQVFFNLNKSRTGSNDRSNGFLYDPSSIAGHMEPPNGDPVPDTRYAIASHLALYIRQSIRNKLNFTTSSGISSSKLLSKLLAAIHKPAQQTFWASTSTDPLACSSEEEAFLAPYLVSKVPGFGFRTQKVLRHHLFGEPLPAPGVWGGAESEQPEQSHSGVQELGMQQRDADQPMTVALLRDRATLSDLKQWFDPRLGQRLWDLLHARDSEPVKDAPDYPLTISVEDSFTGLSSDSLVHKNISRLSIALLNRLELELVQEPASDENKAPDRFVRYPAQLRLSLRFDRGTRVSQSITAPSEIFDLTSPASQRANNLAQTALRSLYTKLAKGKDVGELRIINIAAVNFSKHPPPDDVRLLFSKPSKRKAKAKPFDDGLNASTLDKAALAELPEEIRAEVLAQLGMASPSKKAKMENKGLVKCTWPDCKSSVMAFALADHTRWHRQRS